ncbi:MAG: putative selenium-dependent hydroxylase accessory protein YqeC [Peptococcaceae bacterium]|jgi:probable selenium-dependent hydroxylase accessory protein YqeC|nr:putative selenium-dependent hydroxylase accessory protein YqeC [Peptococcaceae bacterium]
MAALTALLALGQREIVTIVGSGGKTTLLWYLAAAYRRQRVLVTTTTKVRPPEPTQYDLFCDSGSLMARRVTAGIAFAADPAEGADGAKGKLRTLPPEVLVAAAPLYDKVLIEGDGSRNLPLKAWADYEPVVPEITTCTIGVLPLWPLGRPVSAAIIHRLPLFCQVSGAKEGERLTPRQLIDVVTHPAGLMKGSRGRRVLFINQVENQAGKQVAAEFLALLPSAFIKGLALVIVGSTLLDEGEILWR